MSRRARELTGAGGRLAYLTLLTSHFHFAPMDLKKAPTILLAILTALALMAFLRITYVVTMPLAASCFAAAIVWPLYRWVRTKSRWLAMPVSMAAVVVAMAIFFGAIGAAAAFAIKSAPRYTAAVQDLVHRALERLNAAGVPIDASTFGIDGNGLPDWVKTYITFGFTSAYTLLGFLTLIFFFTSMLLMEARLWGEKTRAAFSPERAAAIVDATRATSQKLRQYLLTQTLISLMSGVIEGTFMWLIGVELAFAWGLLFFVLNFIPNIGSVIALIPPVLITLVTLGAGWAVALVAGIIVIETAIGYVVAPMWQGKNLSLSPLIVLLSVVFWGWVWGLAGAILAVPLTVTFVIATAHVEALRPLALMMSNLTSKHELRQDTKAKPAGAA